MNRLLIALFALNVLFSCSEKDQNISENAADFSLEIVDSMRIDYLGNLRIMDYDSVSRSFLAWISREKRVLIINEDGRIASNFAFPLEGPESMNGWVNPIALRNGKVELNVANQGFFRYDFEGNRIWEYKLPYEYYYLNGLKGDPIFSLGKEMAFIRPEQGEMDWDAGYKSLFEGVYSKSILEVIDTVSNATRETMPFPPNSMYSDGNFYYWMFPTVIQSGKEWLLYFRNEMKFWVYKEDAGEVNFQREVSLEVSDGVKAIGVAFEQEQEYAEITKNNFPGTIREIYKSTDKTIVIYTKGISEELTREIDRDEPDGRLELEKLKNYYVAVFDGEFKLLQKDIPVPKGLIFTTIITEDDEILALKHTDFFQTEDDFVIYYKLKLLN
ncbi:hypothetical protein [Algoriphagus aquimarinus]|uniref:DUF4221 domain-containing protein n=1 Tax=Algoriphagus aquimarinus TaxID=237018 RepID=A0A1I1B7A6_9BACT|nr:hypothetical protein [Algoriphagus aquimarinus]SFB44460.1 hypothetical protein SAMN04489723_110134 [Algoriphagus aquimarinus]